MEFIDQKNICTYKEKKNIYIYMYINHNLLKKFGRVGEIKATSGIVCARR